MTTTDNGDRYIPRFIDTFADYIGWSVGKTDEQNGDSAFVGDVICVCYVMVSNIFRPVFNGISSLYTKIVMCILPLSIAEL